MAIKQEVLDAMVAAGASAEVIVAAIKADKAIRSSAAVRQKRYRDSKTLRNGDVTTTHSDVTVTESDASNPSPYKDNYAGARVFPVGISNDIPPKDINNPQSPSGITPTKQKRAYRLPESWTLPDDWREAARVKGLSDCEIDRQSARMLNWSLSAKGGAKLDWFRTWLNWIDDAPRSNARAGPSTQRDYGKGALAKLIRNVDESLKNEQLGQAKSEISGGNVLSLPVVSGVRGRIRDDDDGVSPYAK